MTTAMQLSEQQQQPLATAEVATTQAAELARAQVEAQFLVAMRRPRNEDLALQRMLRECKRPSFADVAMYSLPIGGQRIEGLSIRFAEAASRAWGNIQTQQSITYDDGRKRIVRVVATDLESNTTYSGEAVIDLVVRRKNPGDRVPISVQRNSRGEQSYLVQADERDAAMLTANAASKVMRTTLLRLIPGWVQDECKAQIEATARDNAAEDPDAQRRKIVAAFGDLSVPADQLTAFLGHDLGSASPAEIVELKRAYSAVRDGETSWAELLASKTGERAERKSDPNAALKAKLAAKKRKPEPQPAAEEPHNPETGEVPMREMGDDHE